MTDKAEIVFDQLTDRPIAYFPSFPKITGSLSAGVLLAQLIYWDKAMKGKEFYKTDKEFVDETGLSRHEFRSAKARLIKAGFIATVLKKSPAITHYKVNKKGIFEALSSLPKSGKLDCGKPANKIAEIRQTGLPKSGQHIHTENKSEITTDKNNNKTPENSKDSKPEKPEPPVRNGESVMKSPEEMQIAERKAEQEADCKRFLKYAVEKHEKQRGIPLVINPVRDPQHVYRLVVVKGLSAEVLIKCWDEFVRTEKGWFAGKPRTIPLFASEDVLQNMLEKTRAAELEGRRQIENKKSTPKVCLDPDHEALWERCLEAMRPDILPENFESYLERTVGIQVSPKKVVIGVPTSYHTKCLPEYYTHHIKTGLAAVGISPAPEIEFTEYELVDA